MTDDIKLNKVVGNGIHYILEKMTTRGLLRIFQNRLKNTLFRMMR